MVVIFDRRKPAGVQKGDSTGPHLVAARASVSRIPSRKHRRNRFRFPFSPSCIGLLCFLRKNYCRFSSADDKTEQSKDAQDAIQKLTDATTKAIDEKVSTKEKDILKV